MDIDGSSFNGRLLALLKHIADADFVTFDFEMSGITTGRDRSHYNGKPTLQQQYEEMKQAAETFQVVQVGICCVQKVEDKNYYLARPYNFYLSPLETDHVRLNMDRQFKFSSSACKFLKENDFDFGKMFKSGVPYLSRKEEVDLRVKQQNGNAIFDVVLLPGTTEFAFYRRAKNTVKQWVEEFENHRTKQETLDFVNIGHDNGKDLDRLEKRLVYQLVRNEFPKYKAWPRERGNFMAVKLLDEEEEAHVRAKNLNRFNEEVAKQTGLRWIIEALSRGDLDGIRADWLSRYSDSKADREAAEATLAELKIRLRDKQHVLVGHNLFTDLGFLFATFFGPLPDKVVEFQRVINVLFPNVIDTKFLHTEGNITNGAGRETLKEILAPFRKTHRPVILLHEDHSSYGLTGGNKDHEAGYDSWMTAELYVKLSMQLYENNWVGIDVTPEDPPKMELNIQKFTSCLGATALYSSNQAKSKTKAVAFKSDVANRFSLLDLDDDGDRPNHPALLDSLSYSSASPGKEPAAGQWLPGINHNFWQGYVNMLRVNAADAGVCNLNWVSNGGM